MKTKVIDLADYRTPKSKVFTGRDRGIKIREKSKIDSFMSEFDKVEIRVPVDIMSINPSFLEEFLFNVVKELGKEGFVDKISFCQEEGARYDVSDDLEEAIERILRKYNALTKN